VTSDAAGLCIKAGKRGAAAGEWDRAAFEPRDRAALRAGFAKAGLPEDALILVDDPVPRGGGGGWQLTDYVDCLIPAVARPSSPASAARERAVIIDGDGNCQIYVDAAAADQARAVDIVSTAKTQRPGVCNAAETLLVHARSRTISCRVSPPRCATKASSSSGTTPLVRASRHGRGGPTTTSQPSSSRSS